MKKLLVVVMVLAMAIAPGVAQACWLIDFLSSEAVTYICSGATGKATAADMLGAIEAGKNLIADKEITAVDISSAISILTVVRDTGCFVKDQLVLAFKVVDAANTEVAKMQLKALKTAPPALPEYKFLRDLVK